APQLGTTLILAATNMFNGSPLGIMTIGFSNTNSNLGPLPVSLQQFGLAAGCDLWCSANATVLFPVGGTTSNFSFPVPLNAGFVGLDVFFQAASLDSAAAGGVVVSNGLAASLGY
ncbi:MAG: hypothetical protein KDE27_32605, partial [Planctomycetes bacterium]|nr:hypothetical protein [Planctomycetota bacterium]